MTYCLINTYFTHNNNLTAPVLFWSMLIANHMTRGYPSPCSAARAHSCSVWHLSAKRHEENYNFVVTGGTAGCHQIISKTRDVPSDDSVSLLEIEGFPAVSPDFAKYRYLGHVLLTEIRWTRSGIRVWVCNYLHVRQWGIITHRCPNLCNPQMEPNGNESRQSVWFCSQQFNLMFAIKDVLRMKQINFGITSSWHRFRQGLKAKRLPCEVEYAILYTVDDI